MTIHAPRTFAKYNRLHCPSPRLLRHYLDLFQVPAETVAAWEDLEAGWLQNSGNFGEDVDAQVAGRVRQEATRLAQQVANDFAANLETIGRYCEEAQAVRVPRSDFRPAAGQSFENAQRHEVHPALATSKPFRQHCLGLVMPQRLVRVQALDTELARRHLHEVFEIGPVAQTHDELIYRYEPDGPLQPQATIEMLGVSDAVLPRRAEVVTLRPFFFAGKQRGWVEEVGGVRKPFGVPGRLWPTCWRLEVRREVLNLRDDLEFEEEGIVSRVQVPRGPRDLDGCPGCIIPGETHYCVPIKVASIS